jgi:1-acyl-sn-glycerol-3-phosphate acyltransferase
MAFVINILRPFAWWLCRVMFKIEFRGVDNIPAEGACIITPNHVTYADPIWITVPVRRRIYYMAWDKPFEIPVLGWIMRWFGAFPVNLDSVDASAQKEAKEVLKNGRALVIFPEGGRSKTGKLMPFKMGAFRFALAGGVPIVPVTIDGANKVWPVGRFLPRPGKITVTYHPPIEVDQLSEDTNRREMKQRARGLARQTHDVVASVLDPSCLPELENESDLRLSEPAADDAGFADLRG